MMAGLREVTEYHLQGDGMTLVFHRGDDEEMRLEYNDKVFSGRALYRETTVLGLVVSAIVETIPDLHTVFLTVIIPEAHCPPDARSVPVSTFAVFTTKRTSIAGPDLVSGQIDVYKLVSPLTGNAWQRKSVMSARNSKYSGLIYVKHGGVGSKSEGPVYYLQTGKGDLILRYQDRHPWEPDYKLEFFVRRMVEIEGKLAHEVPEGTAVLNVEHVRPTLATSVADHPVL